MLGKLLAGSKVLEHEILLRKAVLKIPSSNFGVFSLYKYPAKFIPQVPAFVMENYAKKGMKVFDPFAGFGTVGYTARVYGLEYELWDLNPLLEYFHSLCEIEPKPLDKSLIDKIKAYSQEFIPDWSNLEYWHPAEFISLLSKAWGFYHQAADEYTKKLLLVPLLKLTKYFSYADEKVHKLYKSRYAKEKVERLLKEDYKALFYSLLEKELGNLEQRLKEYQSLNPKKVNCKVRAGVDVLEEDLEEPVNILITSPPYLQAQEYIRTTKLELFWLGFKEDFIRSLAKKEIPYRDVPKVEIFSNTYHTYRAFIEEKHLLELYDNYFFAILSVFEKLSKKVLDYMFIFVGPAKIRGQKIPIHRIVIEHMEGKGDWVHERTYIDKIVSRVMFSTEKNPATGIEDQRMDKEYLVVLKRR
jgi:DNA modification methylase